MPQGRQGATFRGIIVLPVPPPSLALENVPWFRDSRAHSLLRTTLEALGYEVMEWMLCPTQLGIPNERKRFYLVASRTPLIQPPPLEAQSRPLASYLSADPKPHLTVEPALRQRFGDAFHCVDPADESAIAACFTSAYGRSPVYAGSYIRQGDHIRHFSPEEIAALLHLPLPFHFPEDRSLRTRWSLVGNSLSVPVVRYVLSALPRLQHLGSLPRLTSHHPPTP